MPDPHFFSDGLIITLAAIFVLIVLSAFFSGSETALTAASEARLHQLKQRGDRQAEIVLRLRTENETLISSILIGNNIVNIGASALATGVLFALFGEAGVAYATVAMTVLLVVFAEVLPKTAAINNADSFALAVARYVQQLVWVLKPFSIAVRAIVRLMLRPFGVRITAESSPEEREEELRGQIDLHRGPGTDVSEERAMLRSILDLDEVSVEAIMKHRREVVMIDADLPPEQILDELMNGPYTRVPLFRGDQQQIVGVLHVKALFRAVHVGHREDLSSLDIVQIANEPWFIPESTRLFDQLQAFRNRREHFALVVDEYGTYQGVVTLEDILEEIVGNIDDEHDVQVAGVLPQSDGSCLVEGKVTIRDLNREFDWSLPDEEASTIAGLVLHEARVIPDVGQEFRIHGFRFKIMRRRRNQITQMRVWPADDGPAGTVTWTTPGPEGGKLLREHRG